MKPINLPMPVSSANMLWGSSRLVKHPSRTSTSLVPPSARANSDALRIDSTASAPPSLMLAKAGNGFMCARNVPAIGSPQPSLPHLGDSRTWSSIYSMATPEVMLSGSLMDAIMIGTAGSTRCVASRTAPESTAAAPAQRTEKVCVPAPVRGP
ncbi:hypothetical protein DL765_005376 [Monosporascus sp. GIB2]|nr:hypothetical protein DL765_005376 [Monosporascus sp. GIB2]